MLQKLVISLAILFVLQSYTTSTDLSEDDVLSKITQARKEDEEALEKLQINLLETIEKITSFTQNFVEIAQEAIDKSAEKAGKNMKILFKESDEIVSSFDKIKEKAKRNLQECEDRFLGESSVLKHLLDLKKEIDYAVKEVKECPMDMDGMECLINALIRGEALLNDAEGIIQAEKGTPIQRAENLIQWIEKCNRKAIDAISIASQNLQKGIIHCR